MRLFILPLLFLSISLAGQSSWSQKIDPVLWDRLASAPQTPVVVLLHQQAQVSAAQQLPTKKQKGAYVYEQLWQTAESTQQQVRQLLDHQQHPYQGFYLINAIALKADESLLQQLAQRPEVAEIIEDQTFVLPPMPREAPGVQYRGVEWGIANIMADSVWNTHGITGTGIVVGGQDTGYDWDHPALIGKYRGYGSQTNHDYNWHDAIHSSTGNPCGNDSPVPCDDHGHGTHTMGTMVGDDGAGNQIGVAPGAKWIGCRNMDQGAGTLSTYLECFEWFLAPYPVGGNPGQGNPSKAPHVINNSWACPPSEGCNSSNWGAMETAINNLVAAGVVVVASAGNSGSSCETVSNPPAIFAGSFSVGATNSSDNIAGFSSRGPVTVDGSNRMKPEISAPGVSVRSSVPGGGFGYSSGTSMAGPHVAGLVALLLEADATLGVSGVQATIMATARPRTTSQNCGGVPGSQIPNNTYGHGIINAAKAVESALGLLPVDWLYFEGREQSGQVLLNWATAAEQQSDFFEVQRSATGQSWSTIGQVPAAGYSQQLQHYTFRDPLPFTPYTYYRLRQVDQDGSYSYSRIVAVSFAAHSAMVFSLFPNPTPGTVTFRYESPHEEAPRLEVFDALGRRVLHQLLPEAEGRFSLTMPGFYSYRLLLPSGRVLAEGKLVVE